MSHRTYVPAVTLLSLILAILLVLLHPFVSHEQMVDYLVIAAAIPATLFVVLYPILSPSFWRSWIGRALFTSSAGLAALLDLSLLAKWFGLILAREVVSMILLLIALGAWLKLAALLREKFRATYSRV